MANEKIFSPAVFLSFFLLYSRVNAMYVDDLEGKLSEQMGLREYRDHFKENVIKVSSWNVRYIPTTTICNFIAKTTPTIFGLQDIKRSRIDDIAGKDAIQECESIRNKYEVFPGSPNTNRIGRGRYNPIFYKKDRRLRITRGSQITAANGGTFWLSNKPEWRGTNLLDQRYERPTTPRTCTWLKFRFAEQKGVSYLKTRPFKAKILELLRNNIRLRSGGGGNGDKSRVTRALRRRRVSYKWSYFYVANTRLEYRDQDVTQSQMKILNDYFRNIVLDRRRYPVIFMGDLGINKASETYNDTQDQGWSDDTPIQSAMKNTLEKANTNYIMRTNKLKGLFADTLYEGGWPYQIARPVFAALLTELSPKREKTSEDRSKYESSSFRTRRSEERIR